MLSVRALFLHRFSPSVKVCSRLLSQAPKAFASRPITNVKPRLERPNLRNLRQNHEENRGYALLLVPFAAFCLGCWQVQRKKWKEDLIAKLEYRTKAEAVPLPDDIEELQSLEYRRVYVRGRFDHSGEMYLGPRSCLDKGESSYSGQLISTSANSSSGYLVITPFIVSSTGQRILVNRGWVPFSKKKPSTRPEGQITEEVELEGVVRLTEPRPQFSMGNKPDVKVWFYRDVDKMAASVDCSPVFLDACAETTVRGGPIGGQTRASLRNEHLSYILTWFSLSAATSAMWYLKYIKKAY